MIPDGTVIPRTSAGRRPSASARAIDLWYSGKAHVHGGNIQAVIAPDGFPLWISGAEPGSVHDIAAARSHALPALYRAAAAELLTLADPVTTAPLAALARRTRLGRWRTLQHITTSPTRQHRHPSVAEGAENLCHLGKGPA